MATDDYLRSNGLSDSCLSYLLLGLASACPRMFRNTFCSKDIVSTAVDVGARTVANPGMLTGEREGQSLMHETLVRWSCGGVRGGVPFPWLWESGV